MPNLIVLRGPIGAGKTSIMQEVCNRLPNWSSIEIDALKRMVDPHASSEWRRKVSLAGGLAMAEQLLQHGRSVITEAHSRWPEQSDRFQALAAKLATVTFKSFLVVAPLEVCLQRAAQRTVPGIDYGIDEPMVTAYHTNLDPLPNEPVIDTTWHSSAWGAELIIEYVERLI